MSIRHALLALAGHVSAFFHVPESNLAPSSRDTAMARQNGGNPSKGFYTPFRGANQRQRRKHARQVGRV